jgi:hypothetical protein
MTNGTATTTTTAGMGTTTRARTTARMGTATTGTTDHTAAMGSAATTAPTKQAALSGRHVALSVVGILVVLGIIGAVAGEDPAQQSAPSPTAATQPPETAPADTAEPETTSKPATTEPASDLRRPVRDGKFEFVVSSFKCESGKCRAAIRVENIGNEPQYMFADNQYLFDTRERQFSAETTLDDLWIKELNPGLTVRGTVVWNVPAGFKPDHLELHDSAFSGGVTVQL